MLESRWSKLKKELLICKSISIIHVAHLETILKMQI